MRSQVFFTLVCTILSLEQGKFNQSTPWNVRIGQLLNTDSNKMLSRWGQDIGLDQVAASTCQAVRNAAIKGLAKNNTQGWLLKNNTPFTTELSNLCYGSGFSMWEGKIVATGACTQAYNGNLKKMKYQDNLEMNMQQNFCQTSKTFYVEKPQKVSSFTDINKTNMRQSIKNKVDLYRNLFRFADKDALKNYPTYENPQLGFGYSYNAHPINARPQGAYNTTLFNGKAYPNWRTLKLKGLKNPEAEEEEALKEAPAGPNKSNYTLVQMSLPSWFCPVICAGLDMSELMPTKPTNNTVTLPAAKKYRFKQANSLVINNYEENDMINTNADNVDPSEDPYGYDLSETTPCVGSLPDGKLCLQKGQDIANWFMQRALNPGQLCNYDSGNCDNLFK